MRRQVISIFSTQDLLPPLIMIDINQLPKNLTAHILMDKKDQSMHGIWKTPYLLSQMTEIKQLMNYMKRILQKIAKQWKRSNFRNFTKYICLIFYIISTSLLI